MKKVLFKQFILLMVISLFLVLSSFSALATISNNVVISEVYYNEPAGASSTEFVELYNPTDSDIILDGYVLQYKTATGSDWTNKVSLNGTIKSRGYFLIGESDVQTVFGIEPEVLDVLGLSNSGGHVRINYSEDKIDKFGWGTALDPEGTVKAVELDGESSERKSNTTHSEIHGNGYDTNDNSNDFITRTIPNPQNSDSCEEGYNYITVGALCTATTIQGAIDEANDEDTIFIKDHTHVLSTTLNVNKEVKLIGESKSGVTIDASTIDGYGISVSADNVQIENLTLIGPVGGYNQSNPVWNDYRDNYGFKISHIDNIILRNLIVRGSGTSEVDLNTVDNALIENVEAYGQNTPGFGLMILNSNNITVTDITTNNNAWAGVSVQTSSSTSDSITFNGNFNAYETSPLLIEKNSPYNDITNVDIPNKFQYITYGFREGHNYMQWFYQETLNDAKNLAQGLINSADYTYSEMVIYDVSKQNYYVIEGMLIQDSIDDSNLGDAIHVAAGLYKERIIIDKPLTLRGATSDFNKNGYAVPVNYTWNDSVESIISNPEPALSTSNLVDIVSDDVVFEGFIVQSLNALTSSSNDHLLRLDATTGTANDGFVIDSTLDNIIIRNNVIGPNTNLDSQDGTNGRMGLYFASPTYPSDEMGITNTLVAGNKIIDAQGNGNNVFIWGAARNYGSPQNADYSGTIIEDNEISGSHRSGIELAGGVSNLIIRNNWIHNQSSTNGGPQDSNLKYGNGIIFIRMGSDKTYVDAMGAENITIENNTIENNEKNGIYLGPFNKVITIKDNKLTNNGFDALQVDLTEEYYSGNTNVFDVTENIIANNNAIYDNLQSGVSVIGTPTNGFVLNAKFNDWGNANPDFDAIISGSVNYEPWIGFVEEIPQNQTDYVVDSVNETSSELTLDTNGTTTVTIFQEEHTEEGNETDPYDSGSFTSSKIKGIKKTISLETSNESAIVWPVLLKIYYNQSDLDDAGITEEQLVGIFYWNTAVSEWQLLVETGVDTTDQNNAAGYLWANLYHFSEYAPGSDVTAPNTYNVSLFPTNFTETNLELRANITDDNASDWSNIVMAEYFIDTFTGDGTGTNMLAVDGSYDSITEIVNATIDISALSQGNHKIMVHGVDENSNWGELANITFIVDNFPDFSGSISDLEWVEDLGMGVINLSKYFSDLDGDDLNYSAVLYSSHSDGLSYAIDNNTGIVNITSDYNWFGDGNITFYAYDYLGAVASSNLVKITVLDDENEEPVLTSSVSPIVFEEDSNNSFSLICNPVESGQVCSNYRYDSGYGSYDDNVIVSVNSATGEVFVSSQPNWHGITYVKFLADDNGTPMRTGEAVVKINVSSVNDFPVINYSAGNINQAKDEDSDAWTFDLTQFETDIDSEDYGTNLTWSVGNINNSLITVSINKITDELAFTAIPNAYGQNLLQLNLTDSYNATVIGSMLVTISSVNDIPFINSTIGPFEVYDDLPTVISLDGKANDDNDSATSGLIWDVLDENSSLWNYAGTDGLQSILLIPNKIAGINNITDTVNIIVKDENGANDSVSVDVTILPVNDEPTTPALMSPVNGSTQATATGMFNLDWTDSTDPELQPLSYHVFFSDNEDPSFNGTTSSSEYTVNNLESNVTYYWYVVANDGVNNATKSSTWQFTTDFDNEPNVTFYQPLSPVIMYENDTMTFNATVYDVDGNVITYNWTVDGIEKLTGTTPDNDEDISFNFTPLFNESGAHTVTLSIIDSNHNVGTPQVWTVNVDHINIVPVLDTISDKTVNEDTELLFNITASDYDMDSLTFTSNHTGLTITNHANNSAATVSWIPTNDYVGVNTVEITVTDGLLSDNQVFTITVTNTNDAPTIDDYYPINLSQSMTEDAGLINFNITASDVDLGDSLSYEWFLNSSSVSTTDTYSASGLSLGIYNVTSIVTDLNLDSDSLSWVLEVTNYVVSSKYGGTIESYTTEDEEVSGITITEPTYGSIEFTEPVNLSDAGNLDVSVEIGQGIIAINTSQTKGLNRSAALAFTNLNFTKIPHIYLHEGYKVFSGGSLCSDTVCTGRTYDYEAGTLTFSVPHFSTYYVEENTTNGPPTITTSAVVNATALESYVYDVDARDPELDILTYSLFESPAGMIISSYSGVISWTPEEVQVGIHNVTVMVSDNNFTVNQSFIVSVARAKKLKIKDLDVKVDVKKDNNLANYETIKREAKPESEIKFDIEVENAFTDEQDLNIEDVIIEARIKDIDDGDDLEEETEEFDLRTGRDKSHTLNFEIPLEVDEGIYDVDIHVEGEDENGTVHEVDWTVYLEVEKDRHDITISKASIADVIRCQEKTTLNTRIVNIGTEDEDEVVIEISSPELDLYSRVENIGLEEGAYNDDNSYTRAWPIIIPDNLEKGKYPITITSYYNTNHESETKMVELEIDECRKTKTETTQLEKSKDKIVKENIEVKVIEAPSQPEPKVIKKSFKDTEEYMFLMIILLVILAGGAIFTIGAAIILLKK